jgi:hypothetical protein
MIVDTVVRELHMLQVGQAQVALQTRLQLAHVTPLQLTSRGSTVWKGARCAWT